MRENYLLNVLGKDIESGQTDPAYWWDEDRIPLHSIDKRVTDLMDLTGKKAVVTGGAGVNLGQACVNRLAGLGADVAVVDLPRERSEAWTRAAGRTPLLGAEGVAEKFSKRWGTNCIAVEGDVLTADGVDAVMRECHERLGGIDILINNVADVAMGPFANFTTEDIDRSIRGTFTGAVYCARAVLDYMIPNGWGRIINVGSESALTAMPGQVMYGALKGGLATFTTQLGAEVEKHGVKVLGVYAGCMWGPNRDLLPDSALGQYALGRTSIQRFELPEEVANMIGFLATDAASAMTGVMIPMGGGMAL